MLRAASNSWLDFVVEQQPVESPPTFDRDRNPRPGEKILALLRAGHFLVSLDSEQDLLHSILSDAVSTLDAQHGAIILADGATGKLQLRAVASADCESSSRPGFSQSLAQIVFQHGESILRANSQDDVDLAKNPSLRERDMASVMCIVLRTPRKKLGVLHLHRSPAQPSFVADDLHLADAMAAHVSAGIECSQLLRKQRDQFYATIAMLAQAVEMRDEYTANHTARVTEYAYLLGQRLDLSDAELHLIRIGTPLHDIGKIGIDDAILRKPGKLTDGEFVIMRSHAAKGAVMLEPYEELRSIVPIVRSHHERWDGRGYPDGLAGEAIPRLARVVAIADAFDAMTSDRPYRAGLPADEAFAEIERVSGTQFDPQAAAAFLKMRPRILQEMQTEQARHLPQPLGIDSSFPTHFRNLTR